ncbi:MAG: hypothetical protein SGI74_00805 [Oligoflexia bacterium]|nr:hypothetical protein [Oligoflexia bacterium]
MYQVILPILLVFLASPANATIRPNGFCIKTLSSIDEFLIDEVEGALDGNARIKSSFVKWVEKKNGKPIKFDEIKPDVKIKLSHEYIQENHSIIAEAKPKLVQAHLQILKQRLIPPKNRIDEIEFNGSRYPILNVLGEGSEGTVVLIKIKGRLTVIKKFKSPRILADHVNLYKILADSYVSVTKVLDADLANDSLMMTYKTGLTIADINKLVIDGVISGAVRDAYRFFHSQFQNSVVRFAGHQIVSATKDPSLYFNLNVTNVLYNPDSDFWIAIDPR